MYLVVHGDGRAGDATVGAEFEARAEGQGPAPGWDIRPRSSSGLGGYGPQREADGKRASAALVAVNCDRAVVCFHDGLGDSQP